MLSLVTLPDDVLALIVYHAVARKRRTAHGNQERMHAGVVLTKTCKRLRAFATPALYRHIHLATRRALGSLTDQLSPPDGIPSALLAHTRSIVLDFGLRILRLEVTDVSVRLATLLSHTRRLESFGDAGMPVGLLEADVFQALLKHASTTLQHLTGFTLHSDTFALGSGTCVEQLARFERLETLATGPFWLPSAHTRLLKGPTKSSSSLYPRLQTIQATFTPTLPLIAVLAQDPLPALREIKAASWEFALLRTFLEAHGPKIVRLDLKREYRLSGYPTSNNKTTQLLRLCPNLRHLACHSVTEVEELLRAGHGRLATLHLSSPYTSSPWRNPEQDEDPTSFPFFPMSTSVMTGLFGQDGWEKRMPEMKTVTIYRSLGLGDAETGRVLERWTIMLRNKDVDLVVI